MTRRRWPPYATDIEWINSLQQIEDSASLLKELVALQDSTLGIGDPYYRDLYEAIIERARQLIYEG